MKFWKLFLLPVMLLPMMTAAHAEDRTAGNDYWEVLQLSAKYAWGIDTLDKALLQSVFSPDAVARYEIVTPGPIKLDDKVSGFEDIYRWLQSHLGRRKGYEGFPWHFVSNQVVDLRGDEGDLRFYMHNRPGIAGGVYYMKVRKTGEGWRVVSLHLEEQIWNASGYGAKAQKSGE